MPSLTQTIPWSSAMTIVDDAPEPFYDDEIDFEDIPMPIPSRNVQSYGDVSVGDIIYLVAIYDGETNYLLEDNRSRDRHQLQLHDMGRVTHIDIEDSYPFNVEFDRLNRYGNNINYSLERRELSLSLDQKPSWEV